MKRFAPLAVLAALAACNTVRDDIHGLEVKPSQEDLKPDTSIYSPETQSLLRGKHALEAIDGLDMQIKSDEEGRVVLKSSKTGETVVYDRVPLDELVPRLHYKHADPPDAFDAFNLMLAEYSRNGLSFPRGGEGDSLTHFEAKLDEDASPWTLERDYEFKANPRYMPNRMSLVNNCLSPGLWELNAVDTSGELFHAWFTLPGDKYYSLVARVNELDAAWTEKALQWRAEDCTIDLDRLRALKGEPQALVARLAPDSKSGYSSQGSRRKLARGFIMMEQDGKLVKPEKLSDLTAHPLAMSEFQPPGKYSYATRKPFDLMFLKELKGAEYVRVDPRTSYTWWTDHRDAKAQESDYIELRLQIAGYSLILGNLPLALLVPQEDFAIHGFGVGILNSDEPAERRKLLLERGPRPSFAYLASEKDGAWTAVNSHDKGLEQIFIRTRFEKDRAWFEVTLTSYERMVDLVKYEIDLTPELRTQLNDIRMKYIPPLYRTYQDDNLR